MFTDIYRNIVLFYLGVIGIHLVSSNVKPPNSQISGAALAA